MAFKKLTLRVINYGDYKHLIMKIIEKTYRRKCLILPCLRYDDSGFCEFFDLLLFILFFSSKFRPVRFVEAELFSWQSYVIYKQNFLEEIIKRTKLCIKLVKERMDENEKKILALTKLLHHFRAKWKKECYGKFEEKKVSGNKIFGKQ